MSDKKEITAKNRENFSLLHLHFHFLRTESRPPIKSVSSKHCSNVPSYGWISQSNSNNVKTRLYWSRLGFGLEFLI